MRIATLRTLLVVSGLFSGLLILDRPAAGQTAEDWVCVGGDRGCRRYSTLTQINQSNVDQLEIAWTYRTGELIDGRGRIIECTPVIVDGVVYVSTANRRVVALDGATGQVKWRFDPADHGPLAGPLASGGVNRGVAFWSDGMPDGERRILHGTSDGRLFSIDARSGQLDAAFGAEGIKDLREDLERDISKLPYGPTSAPAVVGDVVVLGVSNGEGPGLAAPGDIRAFDVRTGKQAWRFHTVPRPGEFGNDTWRNDGWKNRGGANAWGGASVDTDRGLVFVALGSAAFDFYGGDRQGDNLFANCVLALDASTGRRRWHFQTLRHDLWDHDLPVYPTLVTVTRGERVVAAVAQVTKTGFVYVLDRETGEPLFPIREVSVPASDVPGEVAAKTQPVPTLPPPFAAQSFDETNVTNIGPANRQSVLDQLTKLRSGPAFNPPSLQGTVVIPGYHGGANWSGASFDPTTSTLYVNSTNLPNVVQLKEAPPDSRYRYQHLGYTQLRDSEGYPAIQPPWGQLNAIDLNSGQFRWRSTLGEYPELTARGIPPTGTENFGGSIVTAGGLVFIGATKDERFRAFDKQTGQKLWEVQLDAGAYATPATYQTAGKQFVIVAAGGAGKLGTRAGDAFYAFALPSN
ncbi:pyrroloquinoline quinone-dependent dehydrogenase [Roseiconus nitratireducens]|uniref:Pyrroloquinoline quinone-dependent dehydrogenase n=1 Tax=Roseiconus nitratireducens TaxID=2605748 RepID=A0A5M6DIS9_9BACT|nr:pyrroloquinoline quinone-dependent dehydrogenase [Roseiconus nitratireducens]KAA5546089.1 pyrroloquinoline quinone-dependent dehydrogenase [Roseiconus nitratireducens]